MSYSTTLRRGTATPYGGLGGTRIGRRPTGVRTAPLAGFFDIVKPIVKAATGRTGGDDAVEIYNNARSGYLSLRGGTPDPSSPKKLIPKTTYGEAHAFGESFKRFTQEATGTFPSANWAKAFYAFEAVVPGNLAAAAAPQMLYGKNTEFWTRAAELAFATGGSNAVPSSWAKAKEATKEALDELPGNLGKFVLAIPGVGQLITLVKWTILAGGAFALWHYVVAPELAKRGGPNE